MTKIVYDSGLWVCHPGLDPGAHVREREGMGFRDEPGMTGVVGFADFVDNKTGL